MLSAAANIQVRNSVITVEHTIFLGHEKLIFSCNIVIIEDKCFLSLIIACTEGAFKQ
jgi:hypothetical protein